MIVFLIIVFGILALTVLLQALVNGDNLSAGPAWASAAKWITIAVLAAILFLSWLDRALPA